MKMDKALFHPSHPQHRLRAEYTDMPFCCDGCREAGIGLKYKCDACEFDLHRACALAPPAVAHPFYPKCDFRLHYRPPGPSLRVCDACRKAVLGFVFHCARCGFDLHPCCANLPQRLDDGDGHRFQLCQKISGGGAACHRCGARGKGWCYRSDDCKDYNLHVACVKELLVESWEAVYLGHGRKGKTAPLAREVVQAPAVVPSLRGAMQSYHRGRTAMGKVRRCCQIAITALRIIISAVLGDPTAIIAAVVGALLSK